jgi:D-amino peptidase
VENFFGGLNRPFSIVRGDVSRDMRIYMLWDMEGVSGLFTREQAWHWEDRSTPEAYAEGKTLLIDDINASVKAALDAGADELIVADTHSGGGNIELDRMFQDQRVSYRERAAERGGDIRYWMRDLETCDGLMLMGHHAKAGTEGAFLPHTWTSEWADVRINGQSVGELGIEACFGGHWNVPFMVAQGDDYTESEVEATYPGTLMAAVKRAEGNDLCSGADPQSARELTASCVAEAVTRGPDAFEPYAPNLPMTVTIFYHDEAGAEKASVRPMVTRVDALTVESTLEQRCDVVKWILDVGR